MTLASVAQSHREDVLALLALLEEQANAVVFERDVEVACIIAAFLSRNNVSVVGAPGVGKTFLGRVLTGLISGLDGDHYFETQLAPRSDPADLFGAHTTAALRAGQFTRNTEHMLPRARVAHISEFWNAPDAAVAPLNSMLNEGWFYNGGSRESVDLSTLIIDSNGMPPAGHALADRFAIWLVTKPLQSATSVEAMLRGADERTIATGTARRPNVDPVIAWAQIEQAQRAVARIPVGRDAIEALVRLRFKLADASVFPSDRRLVAALGVMKAAAFRAGRAEVTPDDMGMLVHVLWTKPAEIPKVQREIYAVSNPLELLVMDLGVRLTEMQARYLAVVQMEDARDRKRNAVELHRKIMAVSRELVALRAQAKAANRRLDLYSPVRSGLRELGKACAEMVPEAETAP